MDNPILIGSFKLYCFTSKLATFKRRTQTIPWRKLLTCMH